MEQQGYGLPASQRLGGFAVKHLIAILKDLKGGSIGFDPARDDRTATKSAFVSYLLANWSAAEIDAAHDRVRSSYPRGGGPRPTNFRGGGNGGIAGEGSASPERANEQSNEQSNDVEFVNNQGGEPDTNKAEGTGQSKPKKSRAKDKSNDEGEANPLEDDDLLQQAKELIRKALEGGKKKKKQEETQPNNGELQHCNFNLLLATCKAIDPDGNHLNVWLHGPAGTGKTTAARNVAKKLGLDFRFNSALDTGYKLSGFVDANGRLVRTPFREAWENGGVYLFDEVDGSAPSALIEFNAALANGAHSFPDKIVPRHPQCVIIAGANTAGLGGNSEYVGRAKQDAAFLDRFVLIDWPIDEILERGICPNKDWVKHVQKIRKQVKERGLRGVLITPRASIYGASLLAAGVAFDAVEAMTLRKSLTEEQWKQVTQVAPVATAASNASADAARRDLDAALLRVTSQSQPVTR